MTNKPNYLANPILINILQSSKESFEDGIVYLSYDSDNLALEVYLYADSQLTISLHVGDKEITLRDEQKDAVYKYCIELKGLEEQKKNTFKKYFSPSDFTPNPN